MFAKLQFAIRTSLFSSIGYIGISTEGNIQTQVCRWYTFIDIDEMAKNYLEITGTPAIVKGNKSVNLVWFKWGSQWWGSWMCCYLALVERLLTNEEYWNISLKADVSLSLIDREKWSRDLSHLTNHGFFWRITIVSTSDALCMEMWILGIYLGPAGMYYRKIFLPWNTFLTWYYIKGHQSMVDWGRYVICIGIGQKTYSANNWDTCLLEVSVHPLRLGKCAFSRIYIL